MAKFDIYGAVTDRIINALESHTIPWRKPWKGSNQDLPYNGATNYRYNGINVWLLVAQGYGDPRWYTFNQVRKIKGATVRKGESSTMIVYWNFVEMSKKGEDLADENSSSDTVPILRYYRVFNAEQIDGIPELEKEETNEVAFEPIQAAEKVVDSYREKPDINHVSGNRAFYRPLADVITMPKREQFEESGEYYSTLFHELGHATGHPNRLDRKGSSEPAVFGSEVYSKEELVAEFTSAFLCATVGIDNTLENSTAYIKGWLRALKDDKKMAVFAAAQASKAANHILGIQSPFEEE